MKNIWGIDKSFRLAWWSAGITSAVACKIALELYDNVEIFYIHINTAHEDNLRFKAECEKWYGKKIHTVKSTKFLDQFDVVQKTGAVNTPNGAPCTSKLKKDVRFELEKQFEYNLFNKVEILNQIWGFEYNKKEVNRAIRHGQQYPNTNPLFPLIEKGLDKNECAGMLLSAGIQLPVMYLLGYSNNNCIGCVKGGKGYWNKIRVDFPNVFGLMANTERQVGYSCINGTFLDELAPDAGRMSKEIIPSCGVLCEVELAEVPDVSLNDVLEGHKTIYEAIAA